MATRSKTIDGGWAWLILACGVFTVFLNGFMCYSLGIITEAMLEIFDGDLSVTSAVGSVMIGVQCCSGPIAGIVVNRLGCRTCAMLGGIIAMAGLVGASFSRDLMGVMWTFGIVTGIGYGFGYNPANVMVGRYFRKLRPLASGITMAGAGFGMFVGPPCIRYLIDIYGLQGMFLVVAGIASHFCVLGALMRPMSNQSEIPMRKLHQITPKQTSCKICDCDCWEKIKSCQIGILSLRKHLGIILYLWSIFFWSVAESACLLHLPNYCVQQGSSRHQTAFLFTIMGLTNTLSRLFTGFAANDEKISNITLHLGQMGVACICTGLFPLYSRTYAGQMFYAAALGMYIGGINSMINSVVVKLMGLDSLATGFGLVSLFAGVGYMTGPPIAGAIVDFGASYTESYLFASAMFLLSSMFAMVIPLVHKESEDHVVVNRNQDIMIGLEDQNEKLYLNELDVTNVKGTPKLRDTESDNEIEFLDSI